MFGIKHHVICPYYRSPSRKCHMWLWYFVTWLFYLQGNLAHEFTRYLAFVNFAICMWIKYLYTWLARSSISTCEVHTSNVRKQLEGKRSRLRDTRILQWESADASVSDEQVWHIIDGGEEWQPPRIHTQNHTQTHIDTHSHPGLSGRHLFKQGVLMNRLCLSDSLSLTISTYYTCVQYVWPVIVCALRMGCLCLSLCVCVLSSLSSAASASQSLPMSWISRETDWQALHEEECYGLRLQMANNDVFSSLDEPVGG